MLDLTTDKGRFISAALALAAERPWIDVTLADIAVRAGSTLAGLKTAFASKADILRVFAELVDDEVLSRAPAAGEAQAPRDALFEVIMSRFDVLEPWKPGLRSIVRTGAPDPAQLFQLVTSQRWMLEAAGVGSDGLEGAVRTTGLLGVYAGVFRVWLDDDDPGLARTMAALDRRLRRGERIMRRADEIFRGFRRAAGAAASAAETMRSRMGDAGRKSGHTEPPGPGPAV